MAENPGRFSHPTLPSSPSLVSAGSKLYCCCPGAALPAWEREHSLVPSLEALPWVPAPLRQPVPQVGGGTGDRLRNVYKECLSTYLRAELTQNQQKPNLTDPLFQSLA